MYFMLLIKISNFALHQVLFKISVLLMFIVSKFIFYILSHKLSNFWGEVFPLKSNSARHKWLHSKGQMSNIWLMESHVVKPALNLLMTSHFHVDRAKMVVLVPMSSKTVVIVCCVVLFQVEQNNINKEPSLRSVLSDPLS